MSTSTNDEPTPVPISAIGHTHSTATRSEEANSHQSRKRGGAREPNGPFSGIHRSVIRPRSPSNQPGTGQTDEPERPVRLVFQEPTAAEAGR
jgi:hypothetical protein